MATQKIQLKESELREMTKAIILEAVANGEIDEGFLSNMWGGMKNAAQSTGQAIAQRGNKFMADYNAGAAQSAKQDIEKQIQKSQEVIKKEQEKINALRTKYNQYAQNADKYTDKANQNAANRGSNTRYNGYNMAQDTNNQDFYNQSDVDRSNFSARMRGAQQAHNKMRNGQQPSGGRKPQMRMPRRAAVNESVELRNIIRRAINNAL